MLVFIGLGGLLLASALLPGFALLHLAGGGHRTPERAGDRIIIALWSGILSLAVTLLATSTLIPLTPGAGIIIAAALNAIAFTSQAARRETRCWLGRPSSWYLTLITLALVAPFVTPASRFYDTGLYHYQSVAWLSEHGAVTGLALLHDRFGFVSSWFALQAPLDAGPLTARGHGVATGVVVTLLALHLAIAIAHIRGSDSRQADRFAAFALPALIILIVASDLGSSGSPDVPVLALPSLATWGMLLARAEPTLRRSGVGPLWLLGSLAVPLKPSVAPVLVVLAIWQLSAQPETLRATRMMSVVGITSTPFVLISFMQTGCLVFPLSASCMDVSWGVGPHVAQRTSTAVTEWARWSGPTPAEATDWNWLVPWFLSRPGRGLIELTFLLSVLALLVAAGMRRTGQEGGCLPLSVSLSGGAFVFLTAPNPRFLLGYLIVAIAAAGSLVTVFLPAPWSRRLTLMLPVTAVTVSLSFVRPFPLVIPEQLPVDIAVEQHRGRAFSYVVPVVDDRCWAIPIPCAPHPLSGPEVELVDEHRLIFRRTDDAGG